MAFVRVRKRKDGSVYSSVTFDHDSRRSSVSFDNHADALKVRDLMNRVGPAKALEIVAIQRRQRPGLTVAEWLGHHIDHLTGVEPATVRRYRAYLKHDIADVLGDIALADLSRDDIGGWIGVLETSGSSGKTIANKHGFLSGALKAAVTEGHIPSNPCDGRRLPRWDRQETCFLDHSEFALLLESVTEYWRPLVEFLVASGARWSEATALKPLDIDRDQCTVRITRAWKDGYVIGVPKSRKSVRTIDVPEAVLNKLDYEGEWLFCNRANRPVRIHGFHRRVWAPAVAKAKKNGLTKKPRLHDLRHTCASWMIQAGIPLPVVQAHLGHESIQTTIGTYFHVDRRSGRVAAEAIRQALLG